MKKLCVSLMALVALFCVSCSNDPEIPEKNDNGIDVTLSITTNPLTKAAYSGTYSSTKAEVKNLLVYFLDNDGTVITYFDIPSGSLSGSLKDGYSYKFTNLESTVNKIYVVANLNAEQLSVAKGKTTLTSIKETTIALSTQQNITSTGNKIVMTTTDKESVNITFPTTTDLELNGNIKGTVSVGLTPIVSRLEISKISADNTIDITNYKLEAIYVTNFNKDELRLGNKYGSTIFPVDKLSDLENDAYKAFNMYDASTDGLSKPSTTNIYGYHFFPVNSILTANIPHIILKVTGISSSATAGNHSEVISSGKSYYININSYTKNNSSDTFSSFEPGMVYSIGEIKLSEYNLMTDPFGAKNVTVGITVNQWGSIVLDPDFGY